MMVSAHRFRSIGWIALLLVCAALVMVLAFRVNALRSQVHRTELQIVALRKEKLYLETEVETRANQQQLKLWNDVEFGYVAPTAGQYLANERQLAAFAKPDGPDTPAPIRVASADDAVAAEAAFPSVISDLAAVADISAPVARSDEDEDKPAARPADAAERAKATANLGARLAMVTSLKKDSKDSKDGKAKSDKASLAKSGKTAKDDAERSGKGAKLTAGKADNKPGKPAAAKSDKPAKTAKPAPKPAAKGSKSAP
ncbi:hypothetical protein [Novosphingobium sp.]|uniref:hypothetical protein n=1 Tax=Novosphingobium sp. TaxID=1874826 RepID=UPI001D6EA5EE|nr:hypothetical protein [Novosphingobium sp.]MBX9665932.1 hypothetical protein [Novosphingobium sp.]